jgi:tRNA (mo5U34)-methyltransferase
VVAALERRKRQGRGFRVASAALGSAAQFRELSVYDLSPSTVGEFDFVYVGSLLMHLRDPVRALERVRSVCRGRLLVLDNINLGLSMLMPRRPIAALEGKGRPWWWKLNLAGLVRLVEAAGFRLIEAPRRIFMPPGPGHPQVRPSLALLRNEEARHLMVTRLRGDPHAALLAEPVGHHAPDEPA